MILNTPLTIRDGPTLAWRGLLVDTSRHFIGVGHLMVVLDSMELAKLNVLHWHLTDHQAFTFASQLYPELYLDGASVPMCFYT